MKRSKLLISTILVTCGLSMTTYAGQWELGTGGWWYNNGDGTWPYSTWEWLDGNNDGIAECYYFDSNGYLVSDTFTPDGIYVSQGTINYSTVNTTNALQMNKNSQIYTATFSSSDENANKNSNMISFTPYHVSTYPKSYLLSLKPGDMIENTTVEIVREEGDSIAIDNDDMVSFTKIPGSNDLYTAWETYDGGNFCYTSDASLIFPVSPTATFSDTVYDVASSGFKTTQTSLAGIQKNISNYGYRFIITIQDGEIVNIIHPFES